MEIHQVSDEGQAEEASPHLCPTGEAALSPPQETDGEASFQDPLLRTLRGAEEAVAMTASPSLPSEWGSAPSLDAWAQAVSLSSAASHLSAGATWLNGSEPKAPEASKQHHRAALSNRPLNAPGEKENCGSFAFLIFRPKKGRSAAKAYKLQGWTPAPSSAVHSARAIVPLESPMIRMKWRFLNGETLHRFHRA